MAFDNKGNYYNTFGNTTIQSGNGQGSVLTSAGNTFFHNGNVTTVSGGTMFSSGGAVTQSGNSFFGGGKTYTRSGSTLFCSDGTVWNGVTSEEEARRLIAMHG